MAKRVRSILIYLLLFVLLLFSATLWYRTLHQHATDNVPVQLPTTELTLKKETPLMIAVSGREQVMLKAGTRVKITAQHGKNPYYLLAETADGRRGIIIQPELTIRPKYLFDYQEGEYKMSTRQFYAECLGKRFGEFDGKYRRAIFVPAHPDRVKSVTIPMPFLLRDPNSWRAYEPHVVYTDGVATDVKLKRINGGNRLVLRFAPFADWLMKKQWVQQLISNPQYVQADASEEQPLLQRLLGWISLLLYWGLCCTVPLYAVSLLILISPKRLRTFFSAMALYVMPVVVFCCAYLWWLVMMMEGYAWWYVWLPPVIGAVANFYLVTLLLINQCEDCRHIGTQVKVDSRHQGSSQRSYQRVEKTPYRSYTTRNEQIHVRRFRGDELVKEWDEEGRVVTEHGGTIVNTYEDTYHVDHWHNTYRCSICGCVTERDEDDMRFLSRRLLHSDTVDEYREHSAERLKKD